MAAATEYMWVRVWNPLDMPLLGSDTIRANDPKDGGTAPWQILDVYLSPLTQIEFWCGAGANGSSIKFSFHPSKERQNTTIGVFSTG